MPSYFSNLIPVIFIVAEAMVYISVVHRYLDFRDRNLLVSVVALSISFFSGYIVQSIVWLFHSLSIHSSLLSSYGQMVLSILAFATFLKFYAFSKTWAEKGYALAEADQFNEAIGAFDQAIKLNPKNANLWCNKGWAQLGLDLREDALISFEKAIQLDPNNYFAWSRKGHLQNLKEEYEEAIVSFDRAIDAKYPEASDMVMQRAIAHHKLGRYEEAIENYKNMGEADSVAWHNRGLCLASLGKLEEADEALTKALDINAVSREAWEVKGHILRDLGRHK